MEKIKVMIVGNNDNRIFELKSLLGNEEIAFVGFTKYGDSAMEKAISLKTNVIIIQCDNEYDDAIELAENVYVKMPGCSVIILCDRLDVEIIEKAMRAGVRKALQFPIDSKTLIDNIKTAYSVEQSRALNSGSSSVNMQSRVITVFGCKGGIGKTTIAVNLAVVLANMGKKVAVIDTDLQFGDANVFFDIDSKDTIAELVEDRSSSDIDTIKRFTYLHYSGVSVLCAPRSPEYAEYVSAKNIETIINTMRPYYDYIIIDTAPTFNDASMTAIESANLVLLVLCMDISTLRNTKTTLNILDSLQQKDKVEVVINRTTDGIITIKDINRILDMQIKNKISFDFKTALTCHNKGVPIVIEAPRTVIAQEIVQLARNVIKIIDNKV
ncbi:MAG: AAA family ATPase [Bacillota bacterium]|nr:AAA family ATPase [Bacillota bacterium]